MKNGLETLWETDGYSLPRVCVRACLDGDGMVAVMKSSRCHEGTQGCALAVGVLSDVLCAPFYSL